jgi:hypothetical protein
MLKKYLGTLTLRNRRERGGLSAAEAWGFSGDPPF